MCTLLVVSLVGDGLGRQVVRWMVAVCSAASGYAHSVESNWHLVANTGMGVLRGCGICLQTCQKSDRARLWPARSYGFCSEWTGAGSRDHQTRPFVQKLSCGSMTIRISVAVAWYFYKVTAP